MQKQNGMAIILFPKRRFSYEGLFKCEKFSFFILNANEFYITGGKEMKAMYECEGKERELEVTDFYAEIAQELVKEPLDKTKEVRVTVQGEGYVIYSIRKRSGTMFITEQENTLPTSILMDGIKRRFLTCVNPETNAYKFYELIPNKDKDTVTAKYGRMGVQKGEMFGERSYDYPLSMFWIKYQEKIGKGYVDRSDVYLNAKKKAPEDDITQSETNDTPSGRLFAKLKEFAKQAIRTAKVQVPITQAIIDESKRLLNEMRKANTTEQFNNHLLNLIATLQRPVETGRGIGVKKVMANDEKDFAKIILREQDLITAMEGNKQTKTSSCDFSQYHIEVYEATEKQRVQVMRHLSDTLKGKVKNVYRVIPKEQQQKFNEYLETHQIKTVKQLWHGSRNQNWMSILINSLQLNPDAIITGKMFGQGVYFAPSSMKSWNYTSYRGTSWAKGTDDCAFMGLFAVAYGEAYDTDTWSGRTDYKELVADAGKNCLHAHAESALLNDEIVFYDEAAMVLNYIVEFE